MQSCRYRLPAGKKTSFSSFFLGRGVVLRGVSGVLTVGGQVQHAVNPLSIDHPPPPPPPPLPPPAEHSCRASRCRNNNTAAQMTDAEKPPAVTPPKAPHLSLCTSFPPCDLSPKNKASHTLVTSIVMQINNAGPRGQSSNSAPQRSFSSILFSSGHNTGVINTDDVLQSFRGTSFIRTWWRSIKLIILWINVTY